jgi:quercetin dioxygenase-like cupin family protein
MKHLSNATDREATVLSWGVAKWLVTAEHDRSAMSLGEVVVLPGKSHEWHVHDDSDEVVYVLAGSGQFTVGEGNRLTIGPGDAIHIPAGVGHDSHNTGWTPLHLLVMYSPGGPEGVPPVTAHEIIPAGEIVPMTTSVVED